MSLKNKNRKEYSAWYNMNRRCYKEGLDNAKHYIEKGISVCPEWRYSVEKFFEDMGNAPTEKHTLDRIVGTLGYFKENCRWVTQREQLVNRGDFNVRLSYKGRTQCVADWAIELGMPFQVILSRKNKLGWSDEKTLSTPNLKRLHKAKQVIDVVSGVIYESVAEAAKAIGVDWSCLNSWLTGRCRNKSNLMLLSEYNKKAKIQLL